MRPSGLTRAPRVGEPARPTPSAGGARRDAVGGLVPPVRDELDPVALQVGERPRRLGQRVGHDGDTGPRMRCPTRAGLLTLATALRGSWGGYQPTRWKAHEQADVPGVPGHHGRTCGDAIPDRPSARAADRAGRSDRPKASRRALTRGVRGLRAALRIRARPGARGGVVRGRPRRDCSSCLPSQRAEGPSALDAQRVRA